MNRLVLLITLNLLLVPIAAPAGIAASEDEPAWRSVGINPADWSDKPESEDSPMMESYFGNAIIEMNVSYKPSHSGARVEGTVVLELFEQWAPITTTNMIEHVEMGLYDGVFFHRVIDDFVTQSGDPTCKTIGVYPLTSPSCGSGGTGETIPLEHNENLSHVDGAIGMARSQDPDSADSQWYIAETEAHNLDPENRDDDGYATFGIVRDGMSHIRAIATTPTSDDPTGSEEIQNPASSAGRPVYEVEIISMKMVGVADPLGVYWGDYQEPSEELSFFQTATGKTVLASAAILIPLIAIGLYIARVDSPEILEEKEFILEATVFDQ